MWRDKDGAILCTIKHQAAVAKAALNAMSYRAGRLDSDASRAIVKVLQHGMMGAIRMCRFDEEPPSGGTKLGSGAGSFASGMQKRAGQAQADSMGTGGFLNPPPGEVFDETHATPQVPEQGPPGTIKGANLDSAGTRMHQQLEGKTENVQ